MQNSLCSTVILTLPFSRISTLTCRRGGDGADELRGLDALPNHVRNFRRPGMEGKEDNSTREMEGRFPRVEGIVPIKIPHWGTCHHTDNGEEGHREISLKVRANKALC